MLRNGPALPDRQGLKMCGGPGAAHLQREPHQPIGGTTRIPTHWSSQAAVKMCKGPGSLL